MPRVSTPKLDAAKPPALESILRRAAEVKRGVVKGRPHRELEGLWAKDRQAAVRRQSAKRSSQ
jgi:hypothetical protein